MLLEPDPRASPEGLVKLKVRTELPLLWITDSRCDRHSPQHSPAASKRKAGATGWGRSQATNGNGSVLCPLTARAGAPVLAVVPQIESPSCGSDTHPPRPSGATWWWA